MPTYEYEIDVEVTIVFPEKGGGFGTYLPMYQELVVITSSRPLNKAILCNAARNRALYQVSQTIAGSPGLARSGAKPYITSNCNVVNVTVLP